MWLYKILIEEFVSNNIDLLIKDPIQNVYIGNEMHHIEFDFSKYPYVKYKTHYVITKQI